MPTFLITCATGRQGGSAARILLSKGHKFMPFPGPPGATLFKGDFADVPAITEAMKGVTGVLLNPFPDFGHPNGEAQAVQAVLDAARAAGTVTLIVLSTVLRADSAPSDIDRAQFPFMASYYDSKVNAERVHNYIGTGSTWYFPEYAIQRLLTVSFPEGYRLDHLDAADVGKFTVAAFLEPKRFAGREIDLVKEFLTFQEIAEHLPEAAGVEVTVCQRTKEETDARKAPKPSTVDLGEYGIALTSFKEFLAREKTDCYLELSSCKLEDLDGRQLLKPYYELVLSMLLPERIKVVSSWIILERDLALEMELKPCHSHYPIAMLAKDA
ncbi:hypothetical protein C8J57DRAFT_1478192 [Mycena rebaudengoi]|nr:hypothetical protein C8J57DRAFT_1478192 [Mycena rebaudengoi]